MKNELILRFEFLELIRTFFRREGFLDVLTPPIVENPGMETHIHPFKVLGLGPSLDSAENFLHTSPEFAMKELLSQGLEKIFTICHAFRHEPHGPHHRFQFLMLEWYRSHAHYLTIMDDTEHLIRFCHEQLQRTTTLHFQKVTVRDLFLDMLHLDLYNFFDEKEFYSYIKTELPEVPLPPFEYTHKDGSPLKLSYDDLFFLVFLNLIEPKLIHYPFLFLYEYPYPMAALSTLKPTDQNVCERFELYAHGIELCNAFNEVTDIEILKTRFEKQSREKLELYKYQLPEPKRFYRTMTQGYPTSAGIALGVERLMKVFYPNHPMFWD